MIAFRLILVKFTQDTIVQPKDSQWFEFYEPNQDNFIIPLKDSQIYVSTTFELLKKHFKGLLLLLRTEFFNPIILNAI